MGFVHCIRVGTTSPPAAQDPSQDTNKAGEVGLGCRTPSTPWMFPGDTAAAPGPAPAAGSRAGLCGSSWPGEEEEWAPHRARPTPAMTLAGHWSQLLAAHCIGAWGTGPMDELLVCWGSPILLPSQHPRGAGSGSFPSLRTHCSGHASSQGSHVCLPRFQTHPRAHPAGEVKGEVP